MHTGIFIILIGLCFIAFIVGFIYHVKSRLYYDTAYEHDDVVMQNQKEEGEVPSTSRALVPVAAAPAVPPVIIQVTFLGLVWKKIELGKKFRNVTIDQTLHATGIEVLAENRLLQQHTKEQKDDEKQEEYAPGDMAGQSNIPSQVPTRGDSTDFPEIARINWEKYLDVMQTQLDKLQKLEGQYKNLTRKNLVDEDKHFTKLEYNYLLRQYNGILWRANTVKYDSQNSKTHITGSWYDLSTWLHDNQDDIQNDQLTVYR